MDEQKDSRVWKPYWIRGAVYGLLIGIALWILMFGLTIVRKGVVFFNQFFTNLTMVGKIQAFVAVLVISFMFALLGVEIEQISRTIKLKSKKINFISVGAQIGASAVLAILLLNTFAVRFITGKPFDLLPLIENRSIKVIVLFVIGLFIGSTIGYVIGKARIQKT